MIDLWNWLSEPFQYEFMQRALLTVLMVSAVSAVIGAFVVIKGLAFIGDALAHASFAGVAAAFVLGGSIYLGAMIAAVATALAIGFVERRARISLDTAIGILFVGAFALGIVIVSRQSNYTVDLFSFVFGNVLGVGWGDLLLIGIMTLGDHRHRRRLLQGDAFLRLRSGDGGGVGHPRVGDTLRALSADCRRGRGCAEGGRDRPGGSDAGDAGGDSRAAGATAAPDNAPRRSLGVRLVGNRAVRVLLRVGGLRGIDRAGGDLSFRASAPFLAATGAAGATAAGDTGTSEKRGDSAEPIESYTAPSTCHSLTGWVNLDIEVDSPA